MVRASALLYAIVICVLIGGLCASLVFLAELNGMLRAKSYYADLLLLENQSQFNLYLDNGNQSEDFQINESIESESDLLSWGGFSVLRVRSTFKNDSLHRCGLIGEVIDDNTALYVVDNSRPLKVSGSVQVLGDVYISDFGMKKSYLSTKYPNKISIKKNQIKKSKPTLPSIQKINWRKYFRRGSAVKADQGKDYVRSFRDSTLVLDVSSISLNSATYRGNIILQSPSKLIVKRSTILEDVIVVAPSVEIESGFVGSAQFFIQQDFLLEEEAVLKFPSLIYADGYSGKQVVLNEDSQFIGNIIIASETEQKQDVVIEEGCNFVGNIYSVGSVEFKDKIIGSVYAQKLKLNTLSSSYENTLFNNTIDRYSLPVGFAGLPFIDDQKRKIFIKELD